MSLQDIVRERLSPALARGEAGKILAHIDVVVENVYRWLPAGDYGRGDVRRIILEELKR